ncbi:Calx-beta domain-containing protein [Microcystis aeruginosa]|uniref:Calx-beta domain-containing protein n=1 Tax=Microcystis aeruginosa TaxID=1126 RepID=UPI003B5899B9
MTSTLLPILPAVDDVLFYFAQSDGFWANLETAFGTSYDVVKATQLRQQWQSRNFSQFPEIEVVNSSVLGSANGAYGISTNKIYLSESFFASASSDALVAVILEEIGHFLDAQINRVDTVGDEGEYFSALVRGVDLTAQEIARITTENDFANITITGSNISVEKSAPIILTVNTTADQNDGTTTGGLSLRDAILIANADTTNDYIIELQGGQTYFLTNMVFGDLWDNTAKTGDLDILPGGKVTIKSLGTSQAVIDGSGLGSGYGKGNRIFHVLANSNFSLDKITITKSAVGGILVDQNALANISNSIITQNVYVSMSGGSASTRGGGISNFGNTIIQSSTINQNSSGYGGGIYNEGSLTINDSTINENNSTYDGGGIYSSGTLTVTNSVVNSNKTGFNGGGFYNGGTANISKTAFNNNNDTGIYNTGSLTLTDGSINSNLSAGLENKGTTTVTGTSINSNTGNGIENNNILNISQAIINQNGQSGLYNSPDLFGSNNKYANVESTIIDRNGDTGIYNSGTINISKSVVSSNADGGLYNNSGNATVIDTIIQNNITTGFGGGIDNRTANLTVINSLIDGNSATKYGGGIYNYNDTLHNVTIVNSTISNNSASFGGGILNTGYTVPGSRNVPPRDTRATFTAINLTISGNSASRSGGGIYNESRGNLNLSNNTITNNTSTSDIFNISGGTGGGIYNEINGGLDNTAKGVVNTKNTIIAGNFDTQNNSVTSRTLNPDLYGPINGDNNNLIGNLSGASGSVGTGTDLVNPNPKLGPLQNNGGITLTHTVLSNSPAINKGNNLLVPLDSMDIDGDGNKTEQIPFDQRGTGFSRIIGGTVDIGAFEEQQTLPLISLAVSPSSVTEDGTSNLIYTFTRSGVTTNSLIVNYTLGGTATLNTDYTRTGTTNTVTFAANSSTATVTIDPTADITVEDDETVILTLATGTGYTVGTPNAATGTITNDDVTLPSITLAVAPSSVTEDGTTNLVYTFTRSGVTTNPLTVNYTLGGTATLNTDYTRTGTTNTVTFAAGSSTATVTVDPTADTTVESNETVILTLATGTGYTVGTTTAVTGTITNDDGDDISVTPIETFGNTKLVQDATNKLYAQIGNNNPIAIKVGATHVATNTYPGWQILAAETVNGINQVLLKNTTQNLLYVWNLDNNWNWQSSQGGWGLNSTQAFSQETNFQQDFNGDGIIGQPTTLPSITLAVAPSSVTEDGTANLIYTFTRSGVTTDALTVNYTVEGTATNGTDYTSLPTSVTFAAGSATATVTVDPTADTTVESNETVILTLASGTGYTVGTTTAVTGTITNDDFSQLSINDITVVEGKDNNAILTVTVDNPNPQPITFNYTTAPINATANVDYTSKTGTITIAPNTATATISIPILNDNLNEADEAFTVTLSNPVNATINPEGGIGEVIITDTWQSSLTRTLPNNVENLRLIGSNNINGTGNAGNNNITGNSGNN